MNGYNGGGQEQARIECQAFLDQVPEPARSKVLLASVAYCYTLGKEDDTAHFSDNCVWQLGKKDTTGTRSPGIAQMFISALRQIGLIGEPVWTQEGAVLAYRTEHEYSGVPVTFNGTWFNWLKSVSPEIPTSMGLIPKEIRNQAKEVIAKLTDSKFIGMELVMERKGDRFVAHTTQGNLFGFIEKGHEKRLRDHQTWQIEWATATDGNVHAILRPVAAQVGQLALPLPPGAIKGGSKRRLRTTQAWCEMKQLELPFDLDTVPTPTPVQLELFALAA